jgi:hypothetical protein
LINPAKAGILGAASRDMPRSGSLLVSIPWQRQRGSR